ncbi:hypothetical protein [Nostoc sp. ATCC 53789]|nr:hypothetical protein [Nostoc sp. ATCC 53789]
MSYRTCISGNMTFFNEQFGSQNQLVVIQTHHEECSAIAVPVEPHHRLG